MVLLAGAFWPWSQYLSTGDAAAVMPLFYVGIFGGLILALVMSFKPPTATFLAIPYAALEGLAMGGISAMLERRYPGIAMQGGGGGRGGGGGGGGGGGRGDICGIRRHAGRLQDRPDPRHGALQVGGDCRHGCHFPVLPAHHDRGLLPCEHQRTINSSALGIGISLAIIVVAALNLILDFDIMETGAARGAPKYMEWFSAFGLLVTLVWLYMEILRLLANSRRN